MKRGDAFQSTFLKTSDLAGQEHECTIREVIMEVVEKEDDRETQKPIVYFEGKRKGLVLNVTRWDVLEEMYGEDTDDWLGKPVIVFPDTTRYKGKRVACMSLRIPKGSELSGSQEEEPPPPDDDGIPF